MKTRLLFFLLALGLEALVYAQGRFETVLVKQPESIWATNTLDIATNEVAELVSFDRAADANPFIDVIKDSKRVRAFQFERDHSNTGGYFSKGNLVVKGPARIEMIGFSSASGIFTFKIQPERADPNTTQFIVPQDGNVEARMECSADLLEWTPATNGVYSVQAGAKFFRLRLVKGQ